MRKIVRKICCHLLIHLMDDDHFSGEAEVQAVEAEDSSASIYLQLADLFAGSLARVLNRSTALARNHKDERTCQ